MSDETRKTVVRGLQFVVFAYPGWLMFELSGSLVRAILVAAILEILWSLILVLNRRDLVASLAKFDSRRSLSERGKK